MKMRVSAVHARAEELSLHVETPERLDAAAVAGLRAHDADFFIVVAYGLILPDAVLSLPKKAAINGHASLLPRWRGAAPIHRAIAAGDSMTGTTAMLMAKTLDSGPMLCHRQTPINADDTTASLHDRLAQLTADVLAEAVAGFDHLTPVPQNDDEVTWAEKISPAEAEIDFAMPADEIERRIRAFAPFPGRGLRRHMMTARHSGSRFLRPVSLARMLLSPAAFPALLPGKFSVSGLLAGRLLRLVMARLS